MIETWYQVTCDCCGHTLISEFSSLSGYSKSYFRLYLKKYGWKTFNKKDYCDRPGCTDHIPNTRKTRVKKG